MEQEQASRIKNKLLQETTPEFLKDHLATLLVADKDKNGKLNLDESVALINALVTKNMPHTSLERECNAYKYHTIAETEPSPFLANIGDSAIDFTKKASTIAIAATKGEKPAKKAASQMAARFITENSPHSANPTDRDKPDKSQVNKNDAEWLKAATEIYPPFYAKVADIMLANPDIRNNYINIPDVSVIGTLTPDQICSNLPTSKITK